VWRLLFVGLVTGCSNADVATMTMAPTLSCAYAWRCTLIGWRIGINYGPQVVGLHGGCSCKPESK